MNEITTGLPTLDEFLVEAESPGFLKNGADILTAQFPDPVWIVPSLLPAGLTILAGRPKIGKSWLALQIAFAVTSGGRLFDQEVELGRVLFLALEDNERRLQTRMSKQGWTPEAAKRIDWVTMDNYRRYIGALHKEGLPRLLPIVQEGNYKLVVIDTVSRAFMGLKDINDSQEVTAALSPIQEAAIGLEFGVMALDHHNKPKGNNPNPIDDILGSTAKAAVLDTAMGLYRDANKNALRLLAEGRDIEQIDLTLKFDSITGSWQSQGDTAVFVESEREREIVNTLLSLGTADLSTIAANVEQPKSHTCTRLGKLAEKGIVETIKNENGKTLAYSLVESM